MSGSQHSFPPNFGSTSQNEMRSQFGGPQRGQLAGISSPGQQSVGIASPQTYSVNVNMQPPADSPIPTQQLQQPGQPTPQQLQLHMQQRQQQASQQQQENPQQSQQSSAVQQQNPQQSVQPQQSSVPQPAGLQQVSTASTQNVNTRIGASDGSIQSVSQSSVASAGAVTSAGVAGSAPQQPPANQQYNTASLCTYGQETVQDIVSKLQDTFQILRNILPPTGIPSTTNVSNEKRAKLQEYLRAIRALFKRLKLIYEKVNDSSQLQGTEYMHIESLIPLKEEWDVKTSEERKTSEAYRLASEECKELSDLVIVKNAQLKEIIDRLRRIIWEINTMLTMRKS